MINKKDGFTLVELVISITILAIIAVSIFTLFIALVNSTVVAKRKAVALSVATNEMEYLKTLPYDQLAVQGGSIIASNPLPSVVTKSINGINYTAYISINYVDDAYDGCATYPTQELKELYCRNYPSPNGSPNVDTNPQDYKIVNIVVKDDGGLTLAEADTQIAARVSETASNTGALVVKVIDNNGNPVSGSSVRVQNGTTTPIVDVSDNTDSNGVAIFYGLTPDTTNFDYQINASKTGYSSLATIKPAGTLQATYSNVNILSQQSSYATLTIKQQGEDSLLIETTTTSATPLGETKIYAKGGYKKYIDDNDSSYYYDNLAPSDNRPTTNASGLTTLSNLVPGGYYFCGDDGSSGCSVNGTTYYLAAAIPYTGSSPFSPINIPTYDASSPPTTTFSFGGNDYLQKVRLMLTSFSTHPRITTLTPFEASISNGTIGNYLFTITGANLPCSSSASSCATDVNIRQGSNTFPAECTGTASGTELNCSANLTGVVIGSTQLEVSSNGFTLNIPSSMTLGGIIVTQ